jgi:hypothetical protein
MDRFPLRSKPVKVLLSSSSGEAGMIVYPLNPKSGQLIANAKLPVGSKTINWILGVSQMPCPVDGQGWRSLRPEGALIKELRLVCRDEVSLIEQRTAFVLQLRHALADVLSCGVRGIRGLNQRIGLDVFAAFSNFGCTS